VYNYNTETCSLGVSYSHNVYYDLNIDDFEGNETLRTYVKIEGKDTSSIVQKVAQLAVEDGRICVLDNNILDMGWGTGQSPVITGQISGYFGMNPNAFEKECDKIVAKVEGDLEGYSLYFEWATKPNDTELLSLKKKIDKILKPYGNKYEVVNK
jgi:hypothetical protein